MLFFGALYGAVVVYLAAVDDKAGEEVFGDEVDQHGARLDEEVRRG